MAYLNPDISKQGTLNVGDTTLYACPNNYAANIATIKTNCSTAYDISVRVEKNSPPSSIVRYSFNLDAGDVMVDSNGYPLQPGDSVVITTSAANVSYSITGTVYPTQL